MQTIKLPSSGVEIDYLDKQRVAIVVDDNNMFIGIFERTNRSPYKLKWESVGKVDTPNWRVKEIADELWHVFYPYGL